MNFKLRRLSAGFLAVATALSAPTTRAAGRDDRIHALATQLEPQALRLLEQLVNLDTKTGHTEGLDRMSDLMADELRAVGAQIEFPSAAPLAGKNVLATVSGTGRRRILLMAHMDTVFKVGTAKARPFHISGGRAYGPGVVDDKCGVVAGLYALRLLRDTRFTNFATITFLLNNNEETGSVGTRRLIDTLARKHDYVLNLEPGRAGDRILSWRKGAAIIEIMVKGRTAHAGTAPETGRNAALEIAHQILQLHQLENPAQLTTVTPTVVQAGDTFNVIPDQALARADVRALTEEEFQRIARELQTLSAKKLIPDTEVRATMTRTFPPLPRNSATDDLVARAQKIYAELGRTLVAEGTGGASDGSFAAATGTPTLDALGFSGGNPHSEEEYLDLETVVPRLYLLTRLIMDLAGAK